MDIEKILGEKYTFQYKDSGEFNHFKVKSFNFSIDQFTLNKGIANLTLWRGKGNMGFSTIRSVFITPKTKDMPIICYAKIKIFFFNIFVIEIYDTCIEKKSYPTLQAINDKYKDVPTYNPKLVSSKKWLLKESIYKKTKKKSFALSVDAFEEHLREYGRLLLEAPDCDAKLKNDKCLEYINEDLLIQQGRFKDYYLANHSVEELNNLLKKAIFDVAD